MIAALLGRVTKMKITNFMGKTYECLMNPDSLKRDVDITFTENDVPAGVQNPETKYVRKAPDQISFSLLIDGTGIIDIMGGTAEAQLTKLRDAVMSYDGKTHQISPVKIMWGTTLNNFIGRLKSMSINYKMFTTDGKPLRAEVSLVFMGDTPAPTDVKQRANSSPDLSHLIIVKEGDNLPEMCEEIYGNSKMYLEIARINKLTNFRHLKAGSELLFPPLEKI